MGSAPFKRVVVRRAHCDETVEIQWTFNNGTTFIERHTCPPKDVREARQQQQQQQQQEKVEEGEARR